METYQTGVARITQRVILWPHLSVRGTKMAKKRKSIKSALKRKRLLRGIKLRITPRAVRLSIAFEKAHKRGNDQEASAPVEN